MEYIQFKRREIKSYETHEIDLNQGTLKMSKKLQGMKKRIFCTYIMTSDRVC